MIIDRITNLPIVSYVSCPLETIVNESNQRHPKAKKTGMAS